MRHGQLARSKGAGGWTSSADAISGGKDRNQQREIAEMHERMAHVESLRGELAVLRIAIAAMTIGAMVAAQGTVTVP